MIEFDLSRDVIKLKRAWKNRALFLARDERLYNYYVSGDRGVGKTHVVQQYLQANNHAYYFSLADANEKMLLQNFSEKFFPDEVAAENWSEAFYKLAEVFYDKPAMIIFDDCEAMKGNDEFSKAYHRFVRERKRTMLVSVNGLGDTPITILPRTVADFCKALPNYSMQDIARLYAVTGGVLTAMKETESELSFEENLERLLRYDSSFTQYVPMLLRESFRAPESYYPILYSVAMGKHRLSEIAADVGFPNNKCGKYLEELIKAGLVDAEHGWESKHSTYYLHSSYLHFWFSYIYKNRSLQVSDPKRLMEIVLRDLDDRIVIPALRESCIRYMRNLYKGRLIGYFKHFDRAKNKPVSVKFRDGYVVKFDFVFEENGQALFCIFPESLDTRYTKEKLQRILKASEKYGALFYHQIMVFGLHRFSDWCVHMASEVPGLMEVSGERLKY